MTNKATAPTRKEWPTLFKGSMVRAIQKRIKTQTRRVVTARNSLLDGAPIGRKGAVREIWDGLDWSQAWIDPGPSPAGNPGPYFKVPCPAQGTVHRVYPRWRAGDLLWVREHIRVCGSDATGAPIMTPPVWYMADGACPDPDVWLYSKPSIHMPRYACRLELYLLAVRPQLGIQDISEEDAKAEGIEWAPEWKHHHISIISGRSNVSDVYIYKKARECFRVLWESINGPRGFGWEANPPVWALTFGQAKGGE
jgi:hypothetical protein